MRRLTKKIAAAVMSLTLVVAMSTSCFAATWGYYFAASDESNPYGYEGAEGTLTSQTATSWTVKIDSIGWQGCWGGQVFKPAGSVKIVKGQKYRVSFTITSENCDKWVLLKIATDDNYAYGDWIQLKKGKTVKYDKTFTAKCNANSVYFGLVGEMGDRDGTDADASIRYALISTRPNDEDPQLATTITLKNFSLGLAKPAKVSLKSVKAVKSGKATVKYKAVSGAKKYQIQYSLKKNFKSAKKITSKKTSATIKNLKKGKKYYVRVRVYNSSKEYGDWSKAKTVKAK
jgi:hypothetical protein